MAETELFSTSAAGNALSNPKTGHGGLAPIDRRSFLSAATALGAMTALPAGVAAIATAASPRAQWDAAMARMAAVDAAYEASEDQPAELCEAWVQANRALMAMPAPDRAALRWKLDRVFNDNDGEWHEAFSVPYLRQTVADYRRLLGHA